VHTTKRGPLWVKSRHFICQMRCPLYPSKHTFGGAQGTGFSGATEQAGPPHQQRSVTTHYYENPVATTYEHTPSNKGKLTAAKPPFRPNHVWSIRTKLQLEGRMLCSTCHRKIESTARYLGILQLPNKLTSEMRGRATCSARPTEEAN
jgi:hypothetical protein